MGFGACRHSAELVPFPFHVSDLILTPKHLPSRAGGKTQFRPFAPSPEIFAWEEAL